MRVFVLSCSFFVLTLNAFSQQLDGGNGHSIILDQQGNVWTVGRNNFGQLGDSSFTNSSVPKQVKHLPGIKAVSRGYDHSIALDSNGYVYVWGRNNYGQLGIPGADDLTQPMRLPNDSGFVAIEGGHYHSVGLKSDGTVLSWGHDLYGELGNGNREHQIWPVPVMQNDNGVISPLADVVSIASVGYHTLVLKKDGSVWGWGANSMKQLGPGPEYFLYAVPIPGISKMQQIAVGWHHSVGLDSAGKVWVWGSDPAFQFGESNSVWYESPIMFDSLPLIKKVVCGSWHTLAIDDQGRVWGWGKNHYGMLGVGDTISRSRPVLIPELHDIVDVGAGCFQSIALDAEGNLFSFGDNPTGALGLGTHERCFSPKMMLVNINGLLATVPEEATETKRSDPGLIIGIVISVLFLCSLLMNVVFYRRLRKMRAVAR